jgi:hypothetical protein
LFIVAVGDPLFKRVLAGAQKCKHQDPPYKRPKKNLIVNYLIQNSKSSDPWR